MPDMPAAEVARLGALAERCGFDRCWLYDEGLATRDLYVALTALALSTERLHLGPGITNPYTRHPSVGAAAIASLFELSGGRAFMGLGVGGSLTLDPIMMQRHHPSQTLRESIEATRALFGGKPVTYEGRHVRLNRAQLDYGDPLIPIWVAGRGPRVLATAAELADGVSLDHVHSDFLADHVAHVRSSAARSHNELKIAYSATIVVTDDDLDRVRRHMTYRLVDSPEAVKAAIGLTKNDTAALREAMAEGLDGAARLVKDEWILPFVVHGTPVECAATISELARTHGLSEFTVPVPDSEVAQDTIQRTTEIIRLVSESGPRSDDSP